MIKKGLLTTAVILLTGYMICCPKEALTASREGLGLWINTLIPTLLPFIILTDIMIRNGSIDKVLRPFQKAGYVLLGLSPCGIYAFLLGNLCGYPMGAKITSDLYAAHKIDITEAKYLLTFSSCASPAFISSYLVKTCFKDHFSLLFTYGILFFSNMLTMLLFRFCIYRNKIIYSQNKGVVYTRTKKEVPKSGSQGAFLDTSIMNGFETITHLGGYILLFSILSACIRHFCKLNDLQGCLLSGILELTTGIYQLSISSLNPMTKGLAALTLTSFGGICVMAQTRSLLHRSLPVRPYIEGKAVSTVLTSVLFLVFAKII